MLHLERTMSRQIVVSKAPGNSHTHPFHRNGVHRNGVEVANSIERFCAQKQWFDSDQYKWQQLSEVANMRTAISELPRLCKTDFEKGLLEWRRSTEELARF